MFLIVGLGNPGTEYQKTRHNAGFMALDEFVSLRDISRRETKESGFSSFRLEKKHQSLVSRGHIGNQEIVLAKPQTFMNNSGKAVASLARPSFGKLGLAKELAKALFVIHDDIDIPLGKIKVSNGSGSAGHKGVDSIIQSLGTKDFTRIRVGIQPAEGKPENVEDFVLQPFKKTELPLLQSALQNAIQTLEKLSF